MSGGGASVVLDHLLAQAQAGELSAVSWAVLRPGVEIHRLWGDGPAGAGAALLRYAPGARVPRHEHRGHEQILVLSGWQVDERRRYDAGTLFVHPPGTRHAVSAPEGCVVLAVWEGGVEIVDAGPDGSRFTSY